MKLFMDYEHAKLDEFVLCVHSQHHPCVFRVCAWHALWSCIICERANDRKIYVYYVSRINKFAKIKRK